MTKLFKIIFTTGLLLSGMLAGFHSIRAESAQDSSAAMVGIWQGKLQGPGGIELRIVVHVSKAADGHLTATMDSPDQGVNGIQADSASVDGQKFRFQIKGGVVTYEGDISADGKAVNGTFKQGGNPFPLNFVKLDKAPEELGAIEPKRPFPYIEEDVKYDNKSAPGVTLAGTLTLPRSKGPFPAVVLITGSGPQDRDETLLGHKPFLVLSDYLTRRGIAVLRVDDRGTAKSTGNFQTATTADFATDVMASVDYLRSRSEIDHKQIGLIGHSEGGVIAPMVASKDPDIAFIVMMAGTGLTGEQIIILQGALIARANGAPENKIEESQKVQKQLFAVAMSSADRTTAEKQINEIIAKQEESLSPEEKKAAEGGAAKAQVAQLLSPWFRYFLSYDPVPALEKVKCPVLALNGAKDLQVPPHQDLPAIEQALEKGGNTDHQIVELPNLNHLFQTCETGSPAEYAKIRETISPMALETIGNWISLHTHPANQ